MNKKEIKEWVKDIIAKGLDRTDVVDILDDGKRSKQEQVELLEAYDNETAETEKLRLGFFQRRKLRKLIRITRKKATENAKLVEELTRNLKALNKEERRKLEELKEQMIIAIIGNKEKQMEGLADVFEVTDEDGEQITREKLEEADVEEVKELLEELLEQLEKEI